MKPFNLEEAKAGKPVCSRDGKPARIICFDRKSSFPIVANIEDHGIEITQAYGVKGNVLPQGESSWDLMMVSKKKQGWINLYRSEVSGALAEGELVYPTKEKALNEYDVYDGDYIGTFPIEWEE